MADLEERVAALETRVDELDLQTRHATDLGLTAAREALTSREAHQKNIELLNTLRKTQVEHSRTLAEHSRILAEHSQTLAEHSRILGDHSGRLDSIDGKLGQLMLGMHTIESLLRRLVNEE